MAQITKKISYVYQKGIQNPNQLFLFVLGRFQVVRSLVALFETYKPLHDLAKSQSIFSNAESQAYIKSLKKNGIAFGLELPEDIKQGILHYTTTHDCYAGGNPKLGFRIPEKDELERSLQKPLYMAEFYNVSQNCEAISNVIQDPLIREIASAYIGRPAMFTGISLTWTFPVKSPAYDANRQESCSFHYDLEDYSSVRFFFYLTDVTDEGGAHVYVHGSHRKKALRHVLKFNSRKQTDKDIQNYYGQEKIKPIYGKAGTGFVEDIFGFHKGQVPIKYPRLMLQLHFASRRYSSSLYIDDRDESLLRSFKSSG